MNKLEIFPRRTVLLGRWAAMLASMCAFRPIALQAQGTVSLPAVTVYSPQVANQSPAGTFAMPVSALRYEPRVDIHARNLAEGQADVTVRGGIFENTGFQLGAVTVLDPQTGHYLAELPVAPALLSAPDVRTGAALALGAANAGVGVVGYAWREVRSAGAASIGFGDFGLRRAEVYQGYASAPSGRGGQKLGVDFAIARSESDGAVRFGEHEFNRINLHLQRTDAASQTDLFAGYQGKRFGWPNLYTPFNSNETENLQTVLLAWNHRVKWTDGQYFEVGAFQRRNKDDYAFNRFAPLGPVHPFQHTTWLSGATANGRRDLGDLFLNFRAEWLRDKLRSTSLVFGRFNDRTYSKLALVPEKSWQDATGARTILKAGASHEDTNREGGAFAPVFELARELPRGAGIRRFYLGYAESSQVPTYTALNSNAAAGLFRGNPNLGRTKSHNFEMGGSGAVAGWNLEGAVFWRRDDALVDWTFRRGVTARTANAVDVDVLGFELVARRSWQACDLVLGYTALTKKADYRGAPVDASFYALNYARHRLTAAMTVRLGRGFELRMDNVARIQADNLLRVTGGRDALVSALALSYRPAAWRGVELALQADNLWNSDFQDVPAVPAAGRQLSVHLAYAW